MAFGLSKSGSETSQLLQELGLTRRDVSDDALAVLARLRDEYAAMTERLAAAEALADRDMLAIHESDEFIQLSTASDP